MGFFKKTASGVVFNGGRYDGKTLDEVARVDPKYLRWARRDMTVGVPDDIHASIEATMRANGIPFIEPRNKKP